MMMVQSDCGPCQSLCWLVFWAQLNPSAGAGKTEQDPLEIRVGPQTVVMEDAIFPYMTAPRGKPDDHRGPDLLLRPNPESYTGPNYPRDIPRTWFAPARRRHDLGTLASHQGSWRRAHHLRMHPPVAIGQDADLRRLQPVQRRRPLPVPSLASGAASGRQCKFPPSGRPRAGGQAESGKRPG